MVERITSWWLIAAVGLGAGGAMTSGASTCRVAGGETTGASGGGVTSETVKRGTAAEVKGGGVITLVRVATGDGIAGTGEGRGTESNWGSKECPLVAGRPVLGRPPICRKTDSD